MSESVNDYGLGSSDSQHSPGAPHERRVDPLAHGLGARDVPGDSHEGEDYAEGGRHNRLEHGLAGAGYPDANRDPENTATDPLRHGLGTGQDG